MPTNFSFYINHVIVFLSPEVILSDEFTREILYSEYIQSSLMAIAVDEVHLVRDWEDFRPQFGELHVLRTRIRHIPFLGVSASLDEETIKTVRKNGGFRDCELIRTSIDRPEIKFNVLFMEGNMTDFEDLRRFFPQVESRDAITGRQKLVPMDIPKTVFYFDSKQLIRNFLSRVNIWFNEWKYPAAASNWITGYFREMADYDLDRISTTFERRDNPNDIEQSSTIRLLAATEAYGLGAHNPDIRRIINWGIPKNKNSLPQRMGRGARELTIEDGGGEFFLVVPPWANTTAPPRKTIKKKKQVSKAVIQDTQDSTDYGSDISLAESIQLETPTTTTHTREAVSTTETISAKDAKKRMRYCQDLINIINAPCHRQALLEAYQDFKYSSILPIPKPERCCSGCSPSSIPTLLRNPPLKRVHRLIEKYFTEWLQIWRDEKIRQLYGTLSPFQLPGSLFLPDNVLSRVVKYAIESS